MATVVLSGKIVGGTEEIRSEAESKSNSAALLSVIDFTAALEVAECPSTETSICSDL